MCCHFNAHKDIAAKPLTEHKTFKKKKNLMANAEMKEESLSHSAFSHNFGLQMYQSMHHISAKIQ